MESSVINQKNISVQHPISLTKPIEMELYIITLKFGNRVSHLYLEGEGGEHFKKQFEEAFASLYKIKKNCKEYLEFLRSAIRHFKSYGFTRVAK